MSDETTIVNLAAKAHRKFKDTNSWLVLLVTFLLTTTGQTMLRDQAGRMGLTHDKELADITNYLHRIEVKLDEQATRR